MSCVAQVKGLPSASFDEAAHKLQARNVYYIDKRAGADDHVRDSIIVFPMSTVSSGFVCFPLVSPINWAVLVM